VHGRGSSGLFESLGGNYRLDAVQAALLRVKLAHVPQWQARRRANARFYCEALTDIDDVITPTIEQDGEQFAWSVYSVRVPKHRNALRQYLLERGIETAVYYPRAVHLQPALAAFAGREGQFPVAERLTQELLALPVGPELKDEQLHAVVDAVHGYFAT